MNNAIAVFCEPFKQVCEVAFWISSGNEFQQNHLINNETMRFSDKFQLQIQVGVFLKTSYV